MTPRGAGEPAGLPPRGVAQVTTPSSRPIAPRPSTAHISSVRRPFLSRRWCLTRSLTSACGVAQAIAPRVDPSAVRPISHQITLRTIRRGNIHTSTCTMRCIATEVVRGVHRGCAAAGALCTAVAVAHGRGGAARRATRRRSGRRRRWAACLAVAPITVHSATPPAAPRGARHSDRALSGVAAQRAQELRAAHRGL